MDISFQNSARTPSWALAHAGVPLPTQGMQPIPGILDAANVVVLGASIMQGVFGRTDNATLKASLAANFAQAGFTGALQSYARSGDQIINSRDEFAAAKVAHVSGEGDNFYFAHIGGNNVSGANGRPFPGGQATFEADYDALIADITATDTFLPLPLTKRLYGKDNVPPYSTEPLPVIPGNPSTDVNGSLPYNQNILHPRIAALMPEWVDAGGVPYVNPYEIADRFPDTTFSDGTHGYGASGGLYLIAKIAGRALGIAKGSSRAGKSIVYGFGNGEAFWGQNYNRTRQLTGSNTTVQVDKYVWGAKCTDGTFDPHILYYPIGTYQTVTNIAAPDFSRVADTRFHHAELARGLYLQGTQEYVSHFEDLTPGDTLTMSVMGLRDAGGTNRVGRYTLTAGTDVQVLDLDASTASASNQVVFAPAAVPPSGKVSLSVAVAPGSTYGYLHGALLAFS
jgi:hypothetical protein